MKKASRPKPKARKSSKPATSRSKRSNPARRSAPAAKSPVARRMAAFSGKVLEEESVPVAVRSFSEARAGSEGSKVLIPTTGQVEPRLEPILGGGLVVPKAREELEGFQSPPPSKRKARLETPDAFGQVELRQATASGGRRVSRAKPENLQRGASRIHALASAEEAAAKGGKTKRGPQGSFEVQQQTASGSRAPGAGGGPAVPSSLTDWGEVEIGQQTRSGARKVGTLRPRKDDEAESSNES